MSDLLVLVPALPLAGFVLLLAAGSRLSERGVAVVGAGSVGLAAALSGYLALRFLAAPPPGGAVTQRLWTWFAAGDFASTVVLRLDGLSLVMLLVVTGVGFLIHVYAAEYMRGDGGYARFFASMNLFVAMMLVLVLAGDLVLLLLGWEGVGLCSYLLIGFWHADEANGRAARKAFVVTRIGDTALTIGLFLLFWQLGTLEIQVLLERAPIEWAPGSGVAVAAAALLLGGALGKSAQLPLQTWLPDAMAGPTPVSALIHAATMVTAGVYLLARMHTLLELAPQVQMAVAIIGAATLLLAAFSALAQHDIKRVLAYSTISQLGYMFLALGAGAWTAAVFHLVTHAVFKALLFLGAGAVILAMHHDQDIYRMGGLRRKLPLVFWTFLAGAAALAGVPLVTAGFYSKEAILTGAFAVPGAGMWLWAAGVTAAFLTAVYTFKVVFVVFLGPPHGRPAHRPGPAIAVPLAILGFLSLVAGFLELPHILGDVRLLSGVLGPVLPAAEGHLATGTEVALQATAGAASLAGIGVAWLLFHRHRAAAEGLATGTVGAALHRLWASGWGFDAVYDRLIVRPFVAIAAAGRDDILDLGSRALARLAGAGNALLARSQSGLVRWYAAGIAAGAVALLALVVLG